jgi:hypothetical protein
LNGTTTASRAASRGGTGLKLGDHGHNLPRIAPLFPGILRSPRPSNKQHFRGAWRVPCTLKRTAKRGENSWTGPVRWKENRVYLGRTGGFGFLKREQHTTAASGTRGTRMSRGYTLDTRHVPSASKRVFDRGGPHRRNPAAETPISLLPALSRRNEITVECRRLPTGLLMQNTCENVGWDSPRCRVPDCLPIANIWTSQRSNLCITQPSALGLEHVCQHQTGNGPFFESGILASGESMPKELPPCALRLVQRVFNDL